ncbi:MAG: TonB-dependent receptor [Pedobacter sp.]|nr:MAG: TonB-dependent receptor [Pedobacter sp.]
MKGSILTLFIIVLTALLGFSQPLVKVSGIVTDKYDKALPNVTISVLNQRESTLSDNEGKYTIYSRQTDFYIKYTLLGYHSTMIHFKEQNAGRVEKNVKMEVDINELEQVTITNKLNQLSNSNTINIKDIGNLPSATGNFERILKTLPGVSTNNELSSQYSVRGGNFDENLIYVNDIEIHRPILIRNAQQEGISFINADFLSRIKFSAGGFDSRYGDKLSSVVDAKYEKPDSSQISSNLGLLGANMTLKSVDNNNFYLLGLRYKNALSLLQTQDIKGIYKPNFGDVQFFFQKEVNSKLYLGFLGNLNLGQFLLEPTNRETIFGTLENQMRLKIDYLGKEIDKYTSYGGAFTTTFSPRNDFYIKWINSYFETREREHFDVEGAYIFSQVVPNFTTIGNKVISVNRGIGAYLQHARNQLNSRYLSSELKIEKILNNHQFSFGLRVENSSFKDYLNEYHLIDSAGYILPYQGKQFNLEQTIKVQNNLEINTFTTYIQDSYSLTKYADLQVGVRANFNTLTQKIMMSPRLLLAYRPPSDNKIYRFSAGIYQQAPSYRTIRTYDGELFKAQKSQRSYNFSSSLDYAFDGLGTRLKFSSEAYFKYADKLIPYVVNNVRINYLADQIAKGRTVGLDLGIGGEFVKDLLSHFRISFMYADQDIKGDYYINKNSNGTTNIVYPGYLKRPTDQRINFSAFFQDRLIKGESYKVHLNLLYGTRLPVSAPFGERYSDDFYIPAYKRVDIGFSKDFLDDQLTRKPRLLNKYFNSFKAYVEVFNLLDIQNTVSYLWIKDIQNTQFAVPNYLTGRQINFKIILNLKNPK